MANPLKNFDRVNLDVSAVLGLSLGVHRSKDITAIVLQNVGSRDSDSVLFGGKFLSLDGHLTFFPYPSL